jgi:hypothetical protein
MQTTSQPTRSFLATAFVLGCMLCVAGCAHRSQQQEVCEPVFWPQSAVESGDYLGFLEENKKLLLLCMINNSCEIPLFNIGVVYAYSKSPFYDRSKALDYFGQLVKEYPHSPLAYESMVWMDLIEQSLALEKKRRDLQGQIKSKEAAIKSKDKDIESRDAAIDELREQIKRSRDIDVEMGQREREILY